MEVSAEANLCRRPVFRMAGQRLSASYPYRAAPPSQSVRRFRHFAIVRYGDLELSASCAQLCMSSFHVSKTVSSSLRMRISCLQWTTHQTRDLQSICQTSKLGINSFDAVRG